MNKGFDGAFLSQRGYKVVIPYLINQPFFGSWHGIL